MAYTCCATGWCHWWYGPTLHPAMNWVQLGNEDDMGGSHHNMFMSQQ